MFKLDLEKAEEPENKLPISIESLKKEESSRKTSTSTFLFCFKYKFIYFNWRLITLQYCIGFAIHQHESATGIHMFPILNTTHPPCTLPLGHLSVPAPSIQYHASNLDWLFVSYMILYMFQCHSPKSSHPCSLPQSPKDCSIHLCLFCCLTYRITVTIFLNSIYMC